MNSVRQNPLRVAILTMVPQGFAAMCAEEIFKMGRVKLVGVVIDERRVVSWRRYLARRVKKFLRLGPLALIPAMWVRRLAKRERTLVDVPLDVMAAQKGIPVLRVPTINSPTVRKTLKAWGTDLGLSLGNSLIVKRTFDAPRLGTLNVHHSKVPEFRGSPPVLWEIHEGESTVGYTIHRIDSTVDGGAVLKEGAVPIEVADTLEETYYRTRLAVFKASAVGLIEVLEQIARGRFDARPQEKRDLAARTTPSYRQWRRIQKKWQAMRDAR